MARYLGFLILLVSISSICVSASIFYPISDAHRSAASEIFTFSGASLEATYEALATSGVLGVVVNADVKTSTCKSLIDTLSSPTTTLKDLFFGLRVNRLLTCELSDADFMAISARIRDSIKSADSLLDFYYSIGSLVDIKGQTSEADVTLENADGIFRSIKALSQSDGKWRYSSNNPESSTYAAGIALETLGGVVYLASSQIDEYLISTVKNDIMKLFDSVEKYDDGAYYFDEKLVDASSHHGPLSASSSVVRGLTTFATVTSANLNLPGDKISGLAKFFLGIGVPGNAKDLYYQIDALACLESNRRSTVISHTRNDKIKVKVTTVLGSAAPALSVKLMQVFSAGSKDASIIDQELTFDSENGIYILEALPESVDVGKYIFVFEIVLHDAEHKKIYATGGRTKVPIFVTGVMQVDNAKIAVLDSDLGSVETQKKLSFDGQNSVSLSANHLQKLRISFQLSTPLGNAFNPHQAFLKLTHETKVEHIFMVGSSGKQFTVVLDFLGLVEKFYYLSGRYEIQLTVGDAVMENSFIQALGHVELDLPEPPEKATRPPPQSVDPLLRYGPRDEITHIFRTPEKLPRQEVSLAFSGLVLLPFIGFLVGLIWLGVNLKSFPTSTVPATFAILFHVGIGAILFLYALFWIKLDLFTTLKALGFLGIFLMFVGHRTLSHIAATSAKLKSA
uniref:Dolichyl-diphosphooligosaccharide--protein glycosyltransferase subunit 2 n=1 Tax=Daucus carota subsp. sativus TaxID=79200 RepID=A0A166FZN8_DAUCS